MSDQITSQSTLVGIPTQGTISSEVLQAFTDNTVYDIQNITRKVNEHSNSLDAVNVTVAGEVEHIRTSIRSIENNQASILKASKEYNHIIDFFSKKDVTYATNTPDVNKLIVDSKYGQVYLPAISYTPVFYAEDSAGNLQEIANLQFSVTPISEPIVAGYTQSIETSEPRRAVNGQNSESWIRTVSYPLETPVSEVVVTYEVYLDNTATTKQFNTVKINPFPAERTDILGVWYKPTSSSAWILLEEFPQSLKVALGDTVPTPDAITNADHTQYIGQTRNIFAAKVTLRQRNWVEIDNKKVFIYGLQEFDFKQVEYSRQNSVYNMSELDKNNHVIMKITSPDGMNFQKLIGLYSNPLCNMESSVLNYNHMILILSKTPTLSPSDILWNSTSNSLPQDSVLGLSVNTYYLIIMMKYVASISSAASPFNAQTTPVLSRVTLTHKLSTASEAAEVVVDTTDWTTRNWALHKIFVSHMDVYRTSADTGSNIFIMGDDFWSGYTHRDSLTGVIIKPILMSLTTTSSSPGAIGTINYKTIATSLGSNPIIPFIPTRFRIQSVHNTLEASTVSFKVNYTTVSGGPGTEIVVPARDNNVEWHSFIGNDVSDITLSIALQNSATAQPILGQFILILKD